MPDSHTLFIVASNRFRDVYLDDAPKNSIVCLITSTLVALKEPGKMKDPWRNNLQQQIHREIEKFEELSNLRVRVAGHIGPCFGWKNEDPEAPLERVMRDRSFPDEAATLKGVLGGGLDVQVWGFHGDTEWSGIWRVLTTVGQVIEEGATDEDKREFETRLLRVFEDSHAEARTAEKMDRRWTSYEHLSVIAHDILGLFNPLRIKLDTAAERDVAATESDDPLYQMRAREKAQRLRSEVSQLLPDRLTTARALLEEAAGVVHDGKNNDSWKKAQARLQTSPGLNREEIWEWVGELSSLLKDLGRWPDE